MKIEILARRGDREASGGSLDSADLLGDFEDALDDAVTGAGKPFYEEGPFTLVAALSFPVGVELTVLFEPGGDEFTSRSYETWAGFVSDLLEPESRSDLSARATSAESRLRAIRKLVYDLA